MYYYIRKYTYVNNSVTFSLSLFKRKRTQVGSSASRSLLLDTCTHIKQSCDFSIVCIVKENNPDPSFSSRKHLNLLSYYETLNVYRVNSNSH